MTITQRIWPPRLQPGVEPQRTAQGTEFIKADIVVGPHLALHPDHTPAPVSVTHLTYMFDGVHLRVRRQDGQDGITWDELQTVKNEAVGRDVTCVEVYPPASELVYEANVRHLWVVDPDAVPSLWRGRR